MTKPTTEPHKKRIAFRFEHLKEDLVSLEHFLQRLFIHALFASLILIIPLSLGTIGFMYLGDLSPLKAFENALSILGTVNEPYPLNSSEGHIFTALFGLFTETIFFLALSILLSPWVHRIIHKMHHHARQKDCG